MTDTLRVIEKPDGMSRVTLRPAFGGWSLGLERRDDPDDDWEGCSGCWELFTEDQMAELVDLLVRRNTNTVETPLRLPENGDADSDETATDALRRAIERLQAERDTLQDDLLTAWRVRNAALKVAATFVHPGPDGQDYLERERLVREWVDDGHDAVAEQDSQLARATARVAALEAALRGVIDGEQVYRGPAHLIPVSRDALAAARALLDNKGGS